MGDDYDHMDKTLEEIQESFSIKVEKQSDTSDDEQNGSESSDGEQNDSNSSDNEQNNSNCKRENVLKCQICDKVFPDEVSLSFHLQIHLGKRNYACTFCEEVFFLSSSLKMHLAVHSEDANQATEAQSSSYNHEHLSDDSNDEEAPTFFTKKKEVTKPESSFKHKDQKQTDDLFEIIIKKKKKFICPVCKTSFTLKSSLKRHSLNHMNIHPFSCKLCLKSFSRKDALNAHVCLLDVKKPKNKQSSKSKLKKNYTCDCCDKSFSSYDTFRRHKLKVKGIKHQCILCDKSFVRKAYLKIHFESCQRRNKNKSIHDPSSNNNENKEISATSYNNNKNDANISIKCKESSSISPNSIDREYLSSQGSSSLGESKTNVCNICERGFSFAVNLKRHLKTVHGGPKKPLEALFQCDICKKKFNKKGNLMAHSAIHMVVKPYVCEMCETGFSSKYNLKSHQMTHGCCLHSVEK